MDENQLRLTLEYRMTREESLALRVAYFYQDYSLKYFPGIKHSALPSRGDPRRCELFRYCWKMVGEGRVAPEEFRDYVRAQFVILKNIRRQGWAPWVHPNCLVGDGAWRRWQVWRKYVLESKKSAPAPGPDPVAVRESLADTRHALERRLGAVTRESLVRAMESRFLFRLCATGVVSPFFLALSPTVREFAEGKNLNLIEFGVNVGPESIKGAEAHYRELFGDV